MSGRHPARVFPSPSAGKVPPVQKITASRFKLVKRVCNARLREMFPLGPQIASHTLMRKLHSPLNQNADAEFPKRTWSFAVTTLDQLRLRLTDRDFDRMMQAAKPVQAPDRDAFLK